MKRTVTINVYQIIPASSKRILMSIFLLVLIWVGTDGLSAQKHYTMKVSNDSVPGQIDSYEIYIPIAKDFEEYFINKFMEYYKKPGYWHNEGILKVSFIVDENGNMTNPEIIHNDVTPFAPVITNLIHSNIPMIPGTVNGQSAKFVGIFELKYHNLEPRIYWSPVLVGN